MKLAVAMIASVALCAAAPASAQEPTATALTERAPVVLDGRVLFEVGEAGTWSPQQRAAGIGRALRGAADGGEPVHLELAEHDGYPTIRMGAWHLLTVTDSDTPMGVDPGEQAQRWQEVVEAALVQAQDERRAGYRTAAALQVAAALGLAGLAHALLWLVRRRLPHWLVRRLGLPLRSLLGGKPGWQSGLDLVCLVLRLVAWGAALWWSAGRFPATRQARWGAADLLRSSLAAPLFSLGERSVSAFDLLWLIAAVTLLWVSVSLVTRVLSVRLMRATGATSGALQPVATVIRYGLIFIGTLVILQLLGLNLSSLALLASVLGVGIGFGLQGIANNFVSGLIVSFEQPVKPGDFVSLGALQGTVERIGGRATVIRTLDRVSIIVPNSKLLETEVVNWSYGDPVSRLHIPVSVAYGSDVDAVRAALLGAARHHPAVLQDPRPEVRFEAFGDSALNFELLAWSNDPPNQARLRSDLNYQLELNLRRAGIEIPFPQRTLHLPPAEVASLVAQLRGEAPPPPPVVRHAVEPEDNPAGLAEARPHRLDLEALARRMRGDAGVAISDRRHRLSTYPRCFVGAEAVAWLMRVEDISRDEAVHLGQLMLERGLMHHVLDEHPFQDGEFFYRFYADEGAER